MPQKEAPLRVEEKLPFVQDLPGIVGTSMMDEDAQPENRARL